MGIIDWCRKVAGWGPTIDRETAMAAFRKRYARFNELLQANADLADIMAALDAAQSGERPLDMSHLRGETRKAILQCERMAECLGDLSTRDETAILEIARSIGGRIEGEIERKEKGDVNAITLSLSEVDASMAYSVGGKNANLGELRNMADMPVPKGFAVTTLAGTLLLLRNHGLLRDLYACLREIDADRPQTVADASCMLSGRIMEAKVPEEVLRALQGGWDAVFGGETTLCALRSSAVSEDGGLSFSGQYLSVMGVRREDLPLAFKQVLASMFSERVLTYKLANGFSLDPVGMGMCCCEMVDAKAAGVAFSRHPVDLRSNCVLINGVWGLGEGLVDGSLQSDSWQVSRATRKVVEERIALKSAMHVVELDGDRVERRVRPTPEEIRDVPCLTSAQVKEIASMALSLEHHYQYPQDVEWAVDGQGRIVLLQTRPMGLDTAIDVTPPAVGHVRPLLEGGEVAAKGVACGAIFPMDPDGDMAHFPEGAVMLLPHSSPKAMSAMRRAAAIIAETGSLTGHMASLCREFGVPTVMNLPGAQEKLREGTIVTVDALGGRIFEGEVPELLALRLQRRQPKVDTPALALLRRVASLILPLHLVDPQSENFVPENCTSLHDIMRYVHERSYAAMFKLSDSVSGHEGGFAAKLVCPVPLDLHVIDMGGGLAEGVGSTVRVDQILSVPFKHVLDGMLNPDVQPSGPRPVNMRGFMSVMGKSLAGVNMECGARFGDRSYAIVSDRYLNFSSRIGYHYAIVDTWCGDSLSKNYIRFEFAGGAAGDERRSRRARCIALILAELGFAVEVLGDRMRGRFQKYHRSAICPRLDQIGRLLIMTRQMDMLMVDDAAVKIFADKFLRGEYH
ncbi:MAG: pyruvate, phosphate dikinase [Desulfovibrio sp.]|jgi:pyruvate,water dikinase|nr:pyruvate, phosphate dikinase [Desulfovibrio sp.]